MKKIERVKTIQLFVFFILAIICIFLILGSETYYLIADNKDLKTLCTLLWVVLFTVFVCIFIDFTLYSRQRNAFNALDYAVHSDPLAKIANRQGCDEIIEKYIDQSIPDGMGVVMFLLESLNEINRHHTRLLGNKQIRNFSIILKLASTNVCFVGRNGGNVFMAIFEKDSETTMDTFLERVEEKVKEHNKDKDNLPMYYTLGRAIKSEPDDTINGLISKAHKLAQSGKICPAGTVTISERMGLAAPQRQKATKPQTQSGKSQKPAPARKSATAATAPIAAIVPFKETEDQAVEAKPVEAKPVETKPVETAKAPTPITSVLEVRLRKGYTETASKKPASAPKKVLETPEITPAAPAKTEAVKENLSFEQSLSGKYDDIAQYKDYRYSDAEIRAAIDDSKINVKRA